MLLAAHRSGQAGDDGVPAAALGALPEPLLRAILSHAAYPLSAWRPAMEGGRALEQAQQQQQQPQEEPQELNLPLMEGGLAPW